MWNTVLPPAGSSWVVAVPGTPAEATEVQSHNAIAWVLYFVNKMPYVVPGDIGVAARRHCADEEVMAAL